ACSPRPNSSSTPSASGSLLPPDSSLPPSPALRGRVESALLVRRSLIDGLGRPALLSRPAAMAGSGEPAYPTRQSKIANPRAISLDLSERRCALRSARPVVLRVALPHSAR